MSGWYAFRNRDLIPGEMRWAERDPLGLAAGNNVYGDVAQNPARFADPMGLDKLVADQQMMSDGTVHVYFVDEGTFLSYFNGTPVHVGRLDPYTGLIRRGDKFYKFSDLRRAAQGGPDSLARFYEENALDTTQIAESQVTQGRMRMQLIDPNWDRNVEESEAAIKWLAEQGVYHTAGAGFNVGASKAAMAGIWKSGERAAAINASRSLAQAKKGTVTEIKGGKPYPKETSFAHELADLGHNVVVRGRNSQGGDLLVDGVSWELKTLESCTVEAVRRNLRVGLGQASRVFIDGRKAGLTMETAKEAMRQHYNAGRLKSAAEVIIHTTEGILLWRP